MKEYLLKNYTIDAIYSSVWNEDGFLPAPKESSSIRKSKKDDGRVLHFAVVIRYIDKQLIKQPL